MDAEGLLYEIFQALYERWVENVEKPERFVGLQGDTIAIMQPNGEHFGLVIVPAVAKVG